MDRSGPLCNAPVLDDSGDTHPCAKRPHRIGPHVAVVGIGPTARIVWGGSNEVGLGREPEGGWADETQPFVAKKTKATVAQFEESRAKGFTGDACGHCGGLTLVPNGRCTKCTTCGETSGCS